MKTEVKYKFYDFPPKFKEGLNEYSAGTYERLLNKWDGYGSTVCEIIINKLFDIELIPVVATDYFYCGETAGKYDWHMYGVELPPEKTQGDIVGEIYQHLVRESGCDFYKQMNNLVHKELQEWINAPEELNIIPVKGGTYKFPGLIDIEIINHSPLNRYLSDSCYNVDTVIEYIRVFCNEHFGLQLTPYDGVL